MLYIKKNPSPFFGCCKGNTEKCSVTQGQGIIRIRHFIMSYQSLYDTSQAKRSSLRTCVLDFELEKIKTNDQI